jgi:putative FmdB family regulatory protein
MPIYDYVCGACSTTTEVVHGIHDEGPRFCPACGVKGRMKKAFAPPTIVFKGSGWAKKDRSSTSTGRSTRSKAKDDSTTTSGTATDQGSTTKAPDASGAATKASSDD